MLYLIATFEIKPDSLDHIMEAVMPCVEATRAEIGCLSYELHLNLTKDNELVFVERWENRAALESHFKAPHLLAWREASHDYVTERRIEIIEGGDVEVRG